eukprot:CAMPEP_0197470028 /NCGR_PEP_ID=MMETSP1309-20131121/597_1 /TAXON_ID=464262 /ORGANISM="Genus nov. species nov., Strain RCC998" /LENGTH=89 /DNA_ID=CAMNT_0043006489 /DNA_START=95 /DNA_END=364 /DNA_ORIENTATION=-
MPKGGSSSQSSVNVPRGGGARGGARNTGNKGAPASAGARGRRQGPQRMKQSYGGSEVNGISISPLMVLGMSLSFIGFVTFLHIIGKIVG